MPIYQRPACEDQVEIESPSHIFVEERFVLINGTRPWKEPKRLDLKQKCKRKLIIVAVTLLVVSVASVAAAVAVVLLTRKSTPADVCGPNGCKTVGTFLAENLNRSVDPCDNFYEFACGGWPSNSDGRTEDTSERNLRRLAQRLEQVAANEPRYLQLGRRLFGTCKKDLNNTDLMEHELQQQVRAYGDWSATAGSWSSFRFDERAGELARNHRTNIFFDITIDIEPKASTNYTIYLSQPAQQNNFTDCKKVHDLTLENVRMYAPKVANTSARIAKVFRLLCKAGKSAANQTLTTKDNRYITFTSLPELGSFWNWTRFFVGYLGPHFYAAYMEKNPEMVVDDWAYFSLLKTAFRKLRTNWLPRDIRQTLHDCVLFAFMMRERDILMSNGGVDVQSFDHGTLWRSVFNTSPLQVTQMRTKRSNNTDELDLSCAMLADSLLPEVSVRLHLPEDANEVRARKNEVHRIGVAMKTAMTNMFDVNPWMDKPTKRGAVEKVQSLQINAIASDDSLDDAKWEHVYSSLDLGGPMANVWSMRYKILSWRTQDFGKMLLQSPDRSAFALSYGFSALHATAYYNERLNTITVLDGILNAPPAFKRDYPDFFKLASLGFTIGHEMGHAFDPSGVQHGSSGVHENWMRKESKLDYENMTDCLVRQYSAFCEDDAKKTCVDGEGTLYENMADNTGLKIAYLAYTLDGAQRSNLPSPVAGLEDLTAQQAFFVAYANQFCDDTEKEANPTVSKWHSPGMYRVNAVLQNMPEFADAFSCMKGTNMRPPESQTCRVW